MDYPKFEKVNDHTIRIINEKADEVSISSLIENLKQLEEKRDQIIEVIDNINNILKRAIELGITPEEKDPTPKLSSGV
jgi:hypothetical protein